jgi:hypothetical protein
MRTCCVLFAKGKLCSCFYLFLKLLLLFCTRVRVRIEYYAIEKTINIKHRTRFSFSSSSSTTEYKLFKELFTVKLFYNFFILLSPLCSFTLCFVLFYIFTYLPLHSLTNFPQFYIFIFSTKVSQTFSFFFSHILISIIITFNEFSFQVESGFFGRVNK